MRYPSRQSESLLFRELFWNTDAVRDNGGTLVASPTIAQGMVCNGTTQYATYPLTSAVLNGKTALTFEMWFTPTFAYNDGLSHLLYDTTTNLHRIIKNQLGEIIVSLGGTAMAAISGATYSAYWNVNKPNHIVVAAVSGSTQVYLNNVQIQTVATAWSATSNPATLYIGANVALTAFFAGTIHSFSIYATKWDANEVADAYNKQTFSEMSFNKAVVHLPCKSIYANTGDGVELFVDGNMEAAGTTAWSSAGGATLTKQTGTPHGGAQCLRVATAGTAGGAYQGLTTAGKYYHITGWVRSDGTGVPLVYLGGGSLVWTGTTSTSWQYFDLVGSASGSANVSLYSNTTNHYIEWDDVTLQVVDFLTENQGTGADVKVGANGLYGVTLAQNNGFVYDGANSYLDCGSDVVGTSAGTFAALISANSIGETAGRIFGNDNFILKIASANTLSITSNNSTEAASAAILAYGSWATVIVTRTAANPSLANIYINGVLSGTANQSSGTLTAGATNLIIGNKSTRDRSFNGTIKYPTLWTNFQATPTQVREIHNKLMAMINK